MKSDYRDGALRNMFNRHFESNHPRSCHIFTDGSKTDNAVGYAYVVNGEQFAKRIQPWATIYSAELLAILDAIRYSKQTLEPTIVIATDSRSAIQGISQYNPTHPLVRQILHEMAAIAKDFILCWVPSHCGVTLNEAADQAAKRSLEGEITLVGLPRSDVKAKIKSECHRLWDIQWRDVPETNKLRSIKPFVRRFVNSVSKSRSLEKTFTRLRIGHTRLTHGFLIDGSYRPFCEGCLVPLTVAHMMEECPNFNEQRYQIYGERIVPLRTILGETAADVGDKLQRFLSEISILHLI